MTTPLTLVKTSQVKLAAASSAASRGAHEAGGSIDDGRRLQHARARRLRAG